MDKRVWWIIGVIILMILLYVFFKPTGQVILEGENIVLEEGNQTLPPGNETTGEVVLVPGEISACGKLNGSGTYVLTKDVIADAGKSCFVVAANDAVLDCASYSVTGGIISDKQGAIVKDCNIDSLNVSGNGSLVIKKTMIVNAVNQKGAVVAGANIIINSTKENESISVSDTANNAGQVSLGVITSSVSNAGEKVYTSFVVSGSLSGFNETNVAIDSIQAVNITINDITAPVITLGSEPGVTSNSVTIRFNVQETGGIQNCTAHVNERSQEVSSASATGVSTGSNNINVGGLDHETDYEAYVKCLDKAGLEGASQSVSFTTSEESSSPTTETENSESTSEENTGEEQQENIVSEIGAVNMTYQVSQSQFAVGYAKALKVNEKVRIEGKETMVFQVISLSDDSVEIDDGTESVVINVGDSKKFDFNKDGTYDVMVSFGSIEGDAALLTFLEISESVGAETPSEVGEAQGETEQAGGITGRAVEGEKSTLTLKSIIILIAIVVIGVVVYRWIKARNNK